MRRLTLDEPPEVLERLVAAEPVHPFIGHDDLADRLDEDRRCFVAGAPGTPRPTAQHRVVSRCGRGVAHGSGAILDPSAPTADPTAADTAVFYSIWNVEPGLVGLPGGRTPARRRHGRAVERSCPRLTTFVTPLADPGPALLARGRRRRERPPDRRDPVPTASLAACARYLTHAR